MNWLLSIGAKFAQPLLIAALVAIAGLCAAGEYKRLKLKAEVAEYKGALSNLVAHYNETAREADARERKKEQQHAEATIRIADDLGAKLADKDRALRIALDGLRYAEDGARRRALQPRETAPTACRDHEAGADQLSVRDAEFLTRYAHRADRVAVRLAGCQQYIDEVAPKSREEAGKADVE